ncbi:MAG TPA: SgcJ/EcaC family oxidoreductase [Chthoniobacterales bacterium]|jgi:uncharacterized protein (TIGR02246 family)|nr:SgcJ/EcaC family oxidoreductase [Chthoniobacterales bacterium]
MKIHRYARLTAAGIAGLVFLFVVRADGQDASSQSATENALKKLDAEWADAARAKDVEKTVSYYAQNAIVMPPNAAALRTKDAIRKGWKEMIETPGAGLTWQATKVEVAASGDLAYVTGTYEDTITGADGKKTVDNGKYLEVLKKQADGSWKCVADMWNSDLPAPPSP